jgi:hypothetical protein
MKTKVYALFLIFLKKDKSDEYIQKNCYIRATTFNHVNAFRKIIRDADYFHFTRIIIQ